MLNLNRMTCAAVREEIFSVVQAKLLGKLFFSPKPVTLFMATTGHNPVRIPPQCNHLHLDTNL